MPPPPSPPTIKDIARLAKVHFSTVSLALRDDTRISQKTIDRIKEIATSIGYKKTEISASLANFRKSSQTPLPRPSLVFLSNRESLENFNSYPHMRLFHEGALSKALALGYDLELVLVGEKALTWDQARQSILNPNVKGLILGAINPPFPPMEFGDKSVATVKIDSRFLETNALVVTNNQQHGVRTALAALFKRGYQRIGLAISTFDDVITRGVHRGAYLLESALTGVLPLPTFYLDHLLPSEKTASDLDFWIRENQLDAVVSNWTSMPDLLAESSRSIPEDIAYASLCLNEPSTTIAGVLQNHRRVGERAVEALAASLQNNYSLSSDDEELIYVEGKWIDAPSAPSKILK